MGELAGQGGRGGRGAGGGLGSSLLSLGARGTHAPAGSPRRTAAGLGGASGAPLRGGESPGSPEPGKEGREHGGGLFWDMRAWAGGCGNRRKTSRPFLPPRGERRKSCVSLAILSWMQLSPFFIGSFIFEIILDTGRAVTTRSLDREKLRLRKLSHLPGAAPEWWLREALNRVRSSPSAAL